MRYERWPVDRLIEMVWKTTLQVTFVKLFMFHILSAEDGNVKIKQHGYRKFYDCKVYLYED